MRGIPLITSKSKRSEMLWWANMLFSWLKGGVLSIPVTQLTSLKLSRFQSSTRKYSPIVATNSPYSSFNIIRHDIGPIQSYIAGMVKDQDNL